MLDSDFKLIDWVLLDEIGRTGVFPDVRLSQKMGFPRTYLLDRLALLEEQGYVVQEGENFSLTELAEDVRIPLPNLQRAMNEKAKPDSSLAERPFDWTAPYVPGRGWNQERIVQPGAAIPPNSNL